MTGRSLPQPSPEWAYFLDVDGTLIELADTPEAIRVDQELLGLMKGMYQSTAGAMALVSGRTIVDLDRHLGLHHLPLAGEHGLERRDASGRLHRLPVSASPGEFLVDQLQRLAAAHPGLRLERKNHTLAIHYRLAPTLGDDLHRLLAAMILDQEGLQLQQGKYVIEIKPPGYDKGTAVSAFMATPPFQGRMPVFIGDDLTDENAFAAINRMKGMSIKVGPGPTQAGYRLHDTHAVHEWLRTLVSSNLKGTKETT